MVSIVVSCSTMNYVNRWTGDINYPPRQIFRVLVMGWINVLEINLLGELLSRIGNWISRIFRAQNPYGDAITWNVCSTVICILCSNISKFGNVGLLCWTCYKNKTDLRTQSFFSSKNYTRSSILNIEQVDIFQFPIVV